MIVVHRKQRDSDATASSSSYQQVILGAGEKTCSCTMACHQALTLLKCAVAIPRVRDDQSSPTNREEYRPVQEQVIHIRQPCKGLDLMTFIVEHQQAQGIGSR